MSLNCRDGVASRGRRCTARTGMVKATCSPIGLVVQHGSSHGAPQAHGNGCGVVRPCATAPRTTVGCRPDDFRKRSAPLGGRKCATCHGVDHAAGRRRRGGCRWLPTLWCGSTRGCQNRCRLQSPHRGTGVRRTGRPGAPTMAVGLTEHGWTTRAWLPYRVSAAYLDPWRAIAYLCSHWDAFHHGS